MSGRPSPSGDSSQGSSGRHSSGRHSSRRSSWRGDAFMQVGLLVGAVAGAAITILGRRAERSARRGLIDWDVASRIAAQRLRRAPGSLSAAELRAAEPIYAAAMARIVPALGAALETELPGVVDRCGVGDRETWVAANVATFAQLIGKIEAD